MSVYNLWRLIYDLRSFNECFFWYSLLIYIICLCHGAWVDQRLPPVLQIVCYLVSDLWMLRPRLQIRYKPHGCVTTITCVIYNIVVCKYYSLNEIAVVIVKWSFFNHPRVQIWNTRATQLNFMYIFPYMVKYKYLNVAFTIWRLEPLKVCSNPVHLFIH